MAQRYQLNVPCYMPLNGLWQVCMPGTVIDAPDTEAIHASTATKLSPGETAGTVRGGQRMVAVRNVRTQA